MISKNSSDVLSDIDPKLDGDNSGNFSHTISELQGKHALSYEVLERKRELLVRRDKVILH